MKLDSFRDRPTAETIPSPAIRKVRADLTAGSGRPSRGLPALERIPVAPRYRRSTATLASQWRESRCQPNRSRDKAPGRPPSPPLFLSHRPRHTPDRLGAQI